MSERITLLTRRERQILYLAILHFEDDEIAERLGIKLQTVYKHMTRIREKLDVSSRARAARYGMRFVEELSRPA